jgi:putative methyltransferase (TIGR04325 family)
VGVDSKFNVWEGLYASFAEASAVGPGFEGPIWRDRSEQAARDAIAISQTDEPLDYSLRQRNAHLPLLTATVLSDRGSARILDFGGGLGTGFVILAKSLAAHIDRINYSVVEVESICHVGAPLFTDRKRPLFYTNLPANAQFDIVHAASVIQYVENWQALIASLASYGARYLSLGDIYIGDFSSFVTLQNYYGSRIPHWFLNKHEFISEVEGKWGYKLILRTDCEMKVLGVHGPLPMDNFPKRLRIRHGSNLVFAKHKNCVSNRSRSSRKK